ncbi:MAG: tRNA lysidine(34) synthetase TilS [Asticcacaulis sp.]|uniref:tRNA lysidine(34) synthetase TilS n=1 Tax=Asticcacaulis sp. TaxID=1872648 RepID=UPI003F7B760E
MRRLSPPLTDGFAPEALFPDFAARLNGEGPLGVAVSGGGDSLALLYALKAWGRRPLHVVCVDHRINPDGANWARRVSEVAARLDSAFTALSWNDLKPTTGLAAAARTARHRLLATAARAAGCRVLCLGHTADDVIEAQAMRAAGSNVGAPRIWSPAPVWPEGRGLFLYRPLLNARRAALRAWLAQQGAEWIDDPANDNPASLRAQMRRRIAGGGVMPEAAGAALPDGLLPDGLLIEDDLNRLGLLRLNAARLAALPRDEAARLLSAAAVCAGGGDRLPRRAQLDAVLDRRDEGAHILCGARLWRRDGLIWIAREAGEYRRHPPHLHLEAGAQVWDGRFELDADARVTASAARRTELGDADRKRLLALPAPLRGAMPVVDAPDGPILTRAACWTTWRFRATAGAMATERDLDAPST